MNLFIYKYQSNVILQIGKCIESNTIFLALQIFIDENQNELKNIFLELFQTHGKEKEK